MSWREFAESSSGCAHVLRVSPYGDCTHRWGFALLVELPWKSIINWECRGFFARRRGSQVQEGEQEARGRTGGQKIAWTRPRAQVFAMGIVWTGVGVRDGSGCVLRGVSRG